MNIFLCEDTSSCTSIGKLMIFLQAHVESIMGTFSTSSILQGSHGCHVAIDPVPRWLFLEAGGPLKSLPCMLCNWVSALFPNMRGGFDNPHKWNEQRHLYYTTLVPAAPCLLVRSISFHQTLAVIHVPLLFTTHVISFHLHVNHGQEKETI